MNASIIIITSDCLLTWYHFCQGGIGLRLKNLDGHAAVGGFSDLFQHENLPSHSSDENSAPSYRCAGDIKVNDIIVAVGSLDAISPKTCPFEKV